jgi:glycosyltransferase involved in cell wall biosynthesis
MSEPLISVLMPVHNGGEWLAAAVASVLAQDGVALELVVVDDRSPDGAIDRLPASDPRLRIIPVAGAGLVDALNTGLAVVRGHWLARMDADDECLPGRLASQLAYLKQNPEVAIAGCRVEPLGAPISEWRACPRAQNQAACSVSASQPEGAAPKPMQLRDHGGNFADEQQAGRARGHRSCGAALRLPQDRDPNGARGRAPSGRLVVAPW